MLAYLQNVLIELQWEFFSREVYVNLLQKLVLGINVVEELADNMRYPGGSNWDTSFVEPV